MAIPINQPDGFRPGPGHGAADSFADAAGAGRFPSENDLEIVDKLHIYLISMDWFKGNFTGKHHI